MFGSISKVKVVAAVVLLVAVITVVFMGLGSFAVAMNISFAWAMVGAVVGAVVGSVLCVVWTGYMLVTENERESKRSSQ